MTVAGGETAFAVRKRRYFFCKCCSLIFQKFPNYRKLLNYYQSPPNTYKN